MNVDMILQKAAAFDELVAGSGSSEPVVDEIIEKAAAFDELTNMAFIDHPDIIIEKAAAYESLMEEAYLDEVMQKAAAYDELSGANEYDEVADEIMQKAAAYDELVKEATWREALEKVNPLRLFKSKKVAGEAVREAEEAAAREATAQTRARLRDRARDKIHRTGEALLGTGKAVRDEAHTLGSTLADPFRHAFQSTKGKSGLQKRRIIKARRKLATGATIGGVGAGVGGAAGFGLGRITRDKE